MLLALVCTFAVPVPTVNAGWKDKLQQVGSKAKQKTKEAKEKWKERERRCSECGKVIHMGAKCASCKAKAAAAKARRAKKKVSEYAPKVRNAAGRARNKVREYAPRVRDGVDRTRDKIIEYAPKVQKAAKNAQESLRRYGPKLKQTAVATRDRWDRLKPRVQEARLKAAEWYDRHKDSLAEKARDAKERYGPAISKTIRDPENRRKAFEALGTVMEVRRQLKQQQRDSTYRALTFASKLPVRTSSGISTLGELAKERLVSRFPGLEGTDIAEDPAAPITALLTSDRKYFLTKCKVVKSGNGYVSITKAISLSSSFDTDKAMKYLELMEATESVSNAVSTGEGSLDAIERTMSVMGSLNR